MKPAAAAVAADPPLPLAGPVYTEYYGNTTAEGKREAHLPSFFCPVNSKLFIEKVQEITRVQKEVIDLKKKKKTFMKLCW